ncbi:hypothetical protein AMECASPLE_002938 [Ameca splendens]|uniref:EF-hand domain-containing protein n=1 Tax=Ameca splendens TaxID=208324 RepID=A0ABV1A5J6_9TELE
MFKAISHPDCLSQWHCLATETFSPLNAGDPAAIDQRMSSLDKNNDGALSFLEFWQLIGYLASKHGGCSQ